MSVNVDHIAATSANQGRGLTGSQYVSNGHVFGHPAYNGPTVGDAAFILIAGQIGGAIGGWFDRRRDRRAAR